MSSYQAASSGDGVQAESILRFMTAMEFANEVASKIDWIAQPWVAAGALTVIDGQVKSAGKTTFVTHMCRAILDGLPFMDEPTIKTPILYLTEQPSTSFREALERADLLEREDFHIL